MAYNERSNRPRGSRRAPLPVVSRSLQTVSGRLHNHNKMLQDRARAQALADSMMQSSPNNSFHNDS